MSVFGAIIQEARELAETVSGEKKAARYAMRREKGDYREVGSRFKALDDKEHDFKPGEKEKLTNAHKRWTRRGDDFFYNKEGGWYSGNTPKGPRQRRKDPKTRRPRPWGKGDTTDYHWPHDLSFGNPKNPPHYEDPLAGEWGARASLKGRLAQKKYKEAEEKRRAERAAAPPPPKRRQPICAPGEADCDWEDNPVFIHYK